MWSRSVPGFHAHGWPRAPGGPCGPWGWLAGSNFGARRGLVPQHSSRSSRSSRSCSKADTEVYRLGYRPPGGLEARRYYSREQFGFQDGLHARCLGQGFASHLLDWKEREEAGKEECRRRDLFMFQQRRWFARNASSSGATGKRKRPDDENDDVAVVVAGDQDINNGDDDDVDDVDADDDLEEDDDILYDEDALIKDDEEDEEDDDDDDDGDGDGDVLEELNRSNRTKHQNNYQGQLKRNKKNGGNQKPYRQQGTTPRMTKNEESLGETFKRQNRGIENVTQKCAKINEFLYNDNTVGAQHELLRLYLDIEKSPITKNASPNTYANRDAQTGREATTLRAHEISSIMNVVTNVIKTVNLKNNQKLMAIQTDLANSKIRQSVKYNAKLFKGTIGQLPVENLFHHAVLLSWWGTADEILDIIEQHLHVYYPPHLLSQLDKMLKVAHKVGRSKPYPKDAVRLNVRLLNIMKECEQMKITKSGKTPAKEWRRSSKTTETYAKVMTVCLRQYDKHKDPSLLATVLDLFSEIESRGFNPGRLCRTQKLGALARLGRMEKVDAIVDEILQVDEPSQYVAFQILEVYCKFGTIEKAQEIFDKMRYQVAWKPGESFKPTIVESLKKVGYNPYSLPDQDDLGTEIELAPGTRETQLTLKQRLAGLEEDLARASRKDRAKILREMRKIKNEFFMTSQKKKEAANNQDANKEKEIQRVWPAPKSGAYNMLMYAYHKNGNIDKVASLHADLKKQGIAPDDITLSVLARAFADSPFGTELMRSERPDIVPLKSKFIEGNMENLKKGVIFDPEINDVNCLDLHHLTTHQAKISINAYLDAIVEALLEAEKLQKQQQQQGVTEPLSWSPHDPNAHARNPNVFHIIVGKGIGDPKSGRRGPILGRMTRKLLASKQIRYTSPRLNSGRVDIHLSEIYKYGKRIQQVQEQLDENNKKTIQYVLGFSGFGALCLLGTFPFYL